MAISLTQVLGALLVFIVAPLVGGLPLSGWITQAVSGVRLSRVGTANVGVSAAFYHGGKLAGGLAVLMEAAKGIGVVLLARFYFPGDGVWEIIALIALVMGRYWFGRGAGTTNVVWGFILHDWVTAVLTFLISGIGFTLFRQRRQGRLLVLILLPSITALRYPSNAPLVLAVGCLSGLIAWIYTKLPDDLDLPPEGGRLESRAMFRFFQGDRGLVALDRPLNPDQYGQKAATLGQLYAWGYPVPPGYVIKAGDDLGPLLAITDPSPQQPVVVRSSAQDEDSDTASAAGIYASFLGIRDRQSLSQAILACFASYHSPQALQYRQTCQLPERGMAVILQQQVEGQFSGVAFSRDPLTRCGDQVVIEALPGGADQVVSGRVTPEQYRVTVQADDLPNPEDRGPSRNWQLPQALILTVEGTGVTPLPLLQQVAYLARHLEMRYQGVPQDVEWSFDGQTLWLLQSRPITTLQPIWTRKIASEVIPGAIRPLTWSINRPLTCGVWGDIFTLVLGDRAADLDFSATATLHHSHAYFNATLLGNIFRRMGLPPESLEFLTRGAAFSPPPLVATLRNLPGLLHLLDRERSLEETFTAADQGTFQPGLADLLSQPRESLSPQQLMERVAAILDLLRQVTYYNILAPLSLAWRCALLRVSEAHLEGGQNPEIQAIADLRTLAQRMYERLSTTQIKAITGGTSLQTILTSDPKGQDLLTALDHLIATYGYLSPVATDIAIPTWQEDPTPVWELLAHLVVHPPPSQPKPITKSGYRRRSVQARFDLKGRVNSLYNRLLAELRWSFLSLEQQGLQQGWWQQQGDIFFLTLEELQDWIVQGKEPDLNQIYPLISTRRQQFQQDRAQVVPYLVFGNDPPSWRGPTHPSSLPALQCLSGIGASGGIVEGPIRIMTHMTALETLTDTFILVVPYTDAGWAPLLARAQGLIAEVGGRLSHGAIIAREYGIPAVMDVADATQRLHDGQWVRLNGEQGTVEVLDRPNHESIPASQA
ncbi:MAG: glycerol-3-phosphate acyltransferase [Nodosilinea sp.]